MNTDAPIGDSWIPIFLPILCQDGFCLVVFMDLRTVSFAACFDCPIWSIPDFKKRVCTWYLILPLMIFPLKSLLVKRIFWNHFPECLKSPVWDKFLNNSIFTAKKSRLWTELLSLPHLWSWNSIWSKTSNRSSTGKSVQDPMSALPLYPEFFFRSHSFSSPFLGKTNQSRKWKI